MDTTPTSRKGVRKNELLERFNNTLRKRCARRIRKTLSFSKKLAKYVGMIKYFICDYNQHRALHI
ncbi:putative transposase [Parachlamydia acanthamoebae]|uniref:Putative transposase n=1 Tax=Parachlamydia acanthamoebae TaxID=83552 RepID=A0A0C1E442_9BACT|nr:putative transposase [Parachlamydia acanthamoebae]